MKRINLILKTLIVSLLIVGLGACSDSDKEEPTPAENQQKLILAALESDPELSQFTEAFRSIDLSSSAATNFTVLAIKNNAEEGGITADILKRHILEKAYTPSALTEAGKVKSLNGTELIVKTAEGIVSLNNTPIGTHITVGNSTLYILDKAIPAENTFLGLASGFDVSISKVLELRPEVIDLDGATFEWTQEFGGEKTVISTEVNYDFITLAAGEYKLSLKATLPNDKTLEVSTVITVTEPEKAFVAFPNRVFDFVPAPGQTIKVLGDTKEKALTAVYEQIKTGSGNVYMGAFGGYMVVGFDHTIMNKAGFCDFTTKYGGSNISPSVIWVAYDANKNGMPDDDEWYEIEGSEYGSVNDLGIQSYTYQTTKTEDGYAWTTQDGKTGYVTDSYFWGSLMAEVEVPFWITGPTYTLTGRQLKPNIDEDNDFKPALPFAWGYAANQPNGSKQAAIDIDWAIDAKGNKVHLPGVDFIKVVNAIQGMRPMMGEYRYQVTSIEDLHLQTVEITTSEAQSVR
ncbi:MAG: PKD-like domain-containing protein [Dysgonomonas sp.]|uniref:PKD-like domain-containing protein n=1 Tax=Dysgonomonas sp. TaxID=1891233 RepID=UPI003A870C20